MRWGGGPRGLRPNSGPGGPESFHRQHALPDSQRGADQSAHHVVQKVISRDVKVKRVPYSFQSGVRDGADRARGVGPGAAEVDEVVSAQKAGPDFFHRGLIEGTLDPAREPRLEGGPRALHHRGVTVRPADRRVAGVEGRIDHFRLPDGDVPR
ncbi:hypothetical protein D3C78_1338480 [compost metagenome]